MQSDRFSSKNPNYAKGWEVNQFNNWWHTGSLDGTRSILVRSAGGFAWVVILNEGGGGSFWTDFDNLIWNCISSTTTYPAFDLLNSPLQNSNDLNLSVISETSVSATWTNGDGTGRLLLVREGNLTNKFPLDGITYNPGSSFGAGDDLGNGNYVVYSGDGNNVTITDLLPNTKYHFRLFEFNQSSMTGNNSLYLLANSEQDSINTSATSVEDEKVLSEYVLSQNYPNPFNPSTKISWQSPVSGSQNLKIYDMLGNEVATLVDEYKTAGKHEIDFDAAELTSGIYFYQLKSGDFIQSKKMLLLK